ncbi:MAG TPA: hypothetical protein PK177_03380, partial [Burkholderiaceae bacterium]|nr:hypothetical protein [Burkholderiaceae bacterium]
MQYSEALRRRAIEISGRHSANPRGANPRGANRIIAAGKLAGYTPLRLDEFGGAADDDAGLATAPADHGARPAGHETGVSERSAIPAAYRAAFDAGYKAGHQAGDQAGHETGFAQGY